MTASVTLPPRYLRARQRVGGRELALDWRQLGRRKPRVWPGMIWLWRADEARRENAERASMLAPEERDRLYLIGTSMGGDLYALDPRGRVVVVDEIEMAYPVVVARDFAAFETSFVLAAEAQKRLHAREEQDELRGVPAQWRKLDAILAGPRGLPRTVKTQVMMGDIANTYLLAGRQGALLEALTAFVKRHPGQRALATKMRKYAGAWGGGGS